MGGLPSHLQSCRAEGFAWRKLGVWKKGKGWSGLRPLVLIKVRRCKSIKNNLLPPRLLSVVPVPFSIPVSLMLPVPFLEVIIMPVFIMKQVSVPSATLSGPAG